MTIKSIMKKSIYAIALPLAFAVSSNAQTFDGKSLDAFFSLSGKATNLTDAYDNIMQERSKTQNRSYHVQLCPGETAKEDNFDLRYMAFNAQWGRAQFFMTNKNLGDKKEQVVVGGYSMKILKTSEDDWQDPQKEIGHSNVKTSSSDHKTIRIYDLFLNRMYESNKRNCLDLTILMKEEKKGTFGDFLPKN